VYEEVSEEERPGKKTQIGMGPRSDAGPGIQEVQVSLAVVRKWIHCEIGAGDPEHKAGL
jgi:hypothetical protein